MERIYLDHNASTPLAPEVVAAMQPLLAEHWGNPSSGHWASAPAAAIVEAARSEIASLIGAKGSEVVITSGGSEANNTALKGVVLRRLREGRSSHVVLSAVEHPSVREVARYLRGFGARLTEVPVDAAGRVDAERVIAACEKETVLVSVMHANNEVGTLQPLAAIGAAVRARGIVMHTDAAQSAGKIPLDVEALQVDLLTLAGHKLYAPKGIGALYIREGLALDALVHGAGHEGGRRAGTESVLLAAGLGAACRLARLDPCGERLRGLRERLWTRLQQAFGDAVVLNGHASERLPNTLNAGFVDRMGADLLAAAPAIAASLGAACHGSTRVLSPVLAAMGVDERVGLGAIRFSVGRTTTEREVDRAVDLLRAAAGLAG